MFKPKKEDNYLYSNRPVRLPTLPSVPNSAQLAQQLSEAKFKMGIIVEQAWTTDNADQKFIVQVQWKEGTDAPVWTLYEEKDGESTMHWSQPFHPTELDMMVDVLMMVTPGVGGTAKIPDTLKPAAADSPSSSSHPSYSSSSRTASGQQGSAPLPASGFVQPSQQGAVPSSGYAQPSQQAPLPPPNYVHPSQQVPATPGGFTPAGSPPQQQPPYPGAYPGQGAVPPGYPVPPYPPVPGYSGYPPPYPPTPPAQSPYAPLPQAPADDAWRYGAQPATSAPPQRAPDMPRHLPIDYGLISKGANILLGSLLCDAGLITTPTLEAALKVQELVREEKMMPEQAVEALSKLHDMGANIGEYLTEEQLTTKGRQVRVSADTASSAAVVKPDSSGTARRRPAWSSPLPARRRQKRYLNRRFGVSPAIRKVLLICCKRQDCSAKAILTQPLRCVPSMEET